MTETSDPSRRSRRSKRDDPKIIGSWKLGKTIGKGSSGRVKIARHISTGEYAAVKIVSKQALITSRMSMTGMGEQADKILLSIEREIVLMKLIDHPNVLSLYDVWETSNELYLILEYVQNGELFDHLVSKGRLSMQEALLYFQQIISAVDYCHRFNIAHRDLKPENLLLDRDNNIKVADFGMAAWEGGMDMLETSCGSPHYASPEVVQGRAYKGFTSDIWSCGVILYALLVGRLPFDDENIRHLLDKVKRGKFTMPTDIPLAAQDLIARMLQKDVNKRITMQQILVHPWFTCLPPKPLRSPVVAPPSLEMVHRPVDSVNEIDPDIFANLRTLWHGAPDHQIISSLLNDESTWEKAVYSLLLQYRVRRLEDYDGEEGQTVPPLNQKLLINEEKPLPAEPTQQLLAPTTWNDTQTTLKVQEDPAHTAPLRLAHPTPTGPRAPPPKVLPQATPSTSQSPQSIRLVQETVNNPLPTQGGDHDSPKLPPIAVSELGGKSMEQFFSHVANHVNPNPPPTTTGQHRSEIPTIHEPPRLPGGKEDDGRFADADEDDSSISDNVSLRGSIMTARTANTQSSGESSPGVPGFGLGISTQGNQHHRYTVHVPMPANALPAIFSGRVGSVPHPHGPPGRPSFKRSEIPANSMLPPPVPVRPASRAMDRTGRTSSDKENATGTVGRARAGTTGTKPLTGSAGGTYLERRRTLGDRRVQIVLPGEEARFGQKYSQPMTSNDSDASSRSSRSTSTEKTTWFGNLFKFKPATFHLLSVYDTVSSRDACKRLLTAMGVSVTLENSGNLSCRFDGATGVMNGVKAVRFRVELHGVLHSHAVVGFSSSVSMIQEKGALSSFKLLYNRLRREWDLDAPTPILKTPKSVISSAMGSQRRSYDL